MVKRFWLHFLAFFLDLTFVSLSGKPENIDNDVVVLEWVLLAKVSVILRVPEAACAHVETTISLLQDDHVSCELKVFIDVLE